MHLPMRRCSAALSLRRDTRSWPGIRVLACGATMTSQGKGHESRVRITRCSETCSARLPRGLVPRKPTTASCYTDTTSTRERSREPSHAGLGQRCSIGLECVTSYRSSMPVESWMVTGPWDPVGGQKTSSAIPLGYTAYELLYGHFHGHFCAFPSVFGQEGLSEKGEDMR